MLALHDLLKKASARTAAYDAICVDANQLIQFILTGTQEDRNMIRNYAQQYARTITIVLERVPPQSAYSLPATNVQNTWPDSMDIHVSVCEHY